MAQNVILISDAHVKARLWTNYSSVTGDSYEALKKILEENSTHDILISCGDLHDVTRPLAVDHYVVRRFLSHFKHILFIDGNHDLVQNSLLPLYGLNNVTRLSEKPVKIGDIDIFGSKYCDSRDELLDNLREIRANYRGNTNVVVLHQALKEFLGFDGAYKLCAQDIWDILGYDVKVYIGDIHKQGLVKSPQGSGFILSPGPLVPQDIGQAKLPQFYYKLQENGDYKEVPIKVRDFYEVTVETPEDVAKLSTIKRGPYPLAPVVVVHTDKELKWEVPKELEDFIVIKQYKKQEQLIAEVKAKKLTFEQAIEEEVKETENNDTKLVKLCSAVIRVADPVEALDNLLTKMEAIR